MEEIAQNNNVWETLEPKATQVTLISVVVSFNYVRRNFATSYFYSDEDYKSGM